VTQLGSSSAHATARAIAPSGPPVTIIEPPHGWAKLGLSEAWKHRELLLFFIWRDIKVRYKQTAVGSGWALLQPLLTMVIFTIFFGRLANRQRPVR